MKKDKVIVDKLLKAFSMMLDFFGMKIDLEEVKIKRSKNYEERYVNLKKL